MKFYKCLKCGQVLEAVVPKCDKITCCGEDVMELSANTTDAATEKHVPVVTINGDKIKVEVGSAEHPMTEDHWIVFIEIETDKGTMRKVLKPSDKPQAEFTLNDEKFVATYAYCNKHGLWKNA